MEWLENYTQTIHQLDDINRSFLADALANTNLNDRDAVVATMQAVCRTTCEQANEIARNFYRGLSMLQTGKDMTKRTPYDYDPEATRVATYAIVRDAEDEEELIEQLQNRQSYELNRASKVGVWRAGQADGRDVRYARVPVGAETCAWCLMTAGLGYFYMSEETASHTHSHCDCMIVASIGRGDVRIGGYDSTVYRDMWRAANKARAEGNISPELKDRIAREKAAKGKSYRLDTNGTLAVMRSMYGLK